jgi:hypothetical protein
MLCPAASGKDATYNSTALSCIRFVCEGGKRSELRIGLRIGLCIRLRIEIATAAAAKCGQMQREAKVLRAVAPPPLGCLPGSMLRLSVKFVHDTTAAAHFVWLHTTFGHTHTHKMMGAHEKEGSTWK